MPRRGRPPDTHQRSLNEASVTMSSFQEAIALVQFVPCALDGAGEKSSSQEPSTVSRVSVRPPVGARGDRDRRCRAAAILTR
jgi:hypothetical protein